MAGQAIPARARQTDNRVAVDVRGRHGLPQQVIGNIGQRLVFVLGHERVAQGACAHFIKVAVHDVLEEQVFRLVGVGLRAKGVEHRRICRTVERIRVADTEGQPFAQRAAGPPVVAEEALAQPGAEEGVDGLAPLQPRLGRAVFVLRVVDGKLVVVQIPEHAPDAADDGVGIVIEVRDQRRADVQLVEGALGQVPVVETKADRIGLGQVEDVFGQKVGEQLGALVADLVLAVEIQRDGFLLVLEIGLRNALPRIATEVTGNRWTVGVHLATLGLAASLIAAGAENLLGIAVVGVDSERVLEPVQRQDAAVVVTGAVGVVLHLVVILVIVLTQDAVPVDVPGRERVASPG